MTGLRQAPPFWFPAWRSRPRGDRHLRPWRLLLVGVLTRIGPAFCAFLASAMFGTIAEIPGASVDSRAADAIGAWATVMLLTVFSPLYGIVLVPVALVVLVIAMRFGFAGWGMAVLLALGIAALLAALFGAAAGDGDVPTLSALVVPVVLFHALVLWSATRWLLPATLIVPAE